MIDQNLPTPTQPQKTPISPGIPVSPAASIPAASAAPPATSLPKPLGGRVGPPPTTPQAVPKAPSITTAVPASAMKPGTTVPAGLSREAPGGTSPPSPPKPDSQVKPGQVKTAPSVTAPQQKLKDDTGKLPSLAKPKTFPQKKWIMIGAAIVAFIVLIVAAFSMFGKAAKPAPSSKTDLPAGQAGLPPTDEAQPATGQVVTITYWGLWEPTTVFAEVLADFEKENPGIKVDYRKQSHLDYRERLQSAIISGNGPDLFRFHASWTPMLSAELSPMPSKVMSLSQFSTTFYPVAAQQLQLEGNIVGIPLMYDGLGLYYNKDILKTAGVEPPTSWAELRKLADELTVPSKRSERNDDNIERGGLAIGNSTNVEHFSDIIGLLILQNGGSPNKPNSTEVKDALTFYTNFMKTDKVWSNRLPSSTVAFARGEAAMMLAPSWRAHDIKAMSPDLNFGIAPVPQLSEDKVTWATYWAEGVSEKSKNKDQAWALLKYLSGKEAMKKFFATAGETRSFGELYSRVDLADQISTNPLLEPYLLDAPKSQGWYLSSYTHDNGINDQLIKYYADAVTSILDGDGVNESLMTIESGTKQVLNQFQAL